MKLIKQENLSNVVGGDIDRNYLGVMYTLLVFGGAIVMGTYIDFPTNKQQDNEQRDTNATDSSF